MKNKAKELLEYTKHQLQSLLFHYEYRTSPKHFTRESILGFANTAFIVLHMIKKSIKAELMDYFYEINKEIDVPSRQALSQAREKISYLAFKDFFEKSCELAADDEGAKKHKGYRIFAVDGTSFVVGVLRKLEDYFGKSTTVKDKAMCRISAVVDILNNCIVNAVVSPFSVGERKLALKQIEELKAAKNALFLFDRGYWSVGLVSKIIQNEQKFLMRIQGSNLNAAKKQKLRCYSFILPGGNEEILVTNLSEDEMSDNDLVCLYAKRWGIETKYLELKDRLQIDKFSGESSNIVLQDIYSTLYISNLVAFLCFESDELIKEKIADKGNKYEQKTNRSTCISALRKRFVDICLLENPLRRDAALQRLVKDISKDVTYAGKSKPRPRNNNHHKGHRKDSSKPIL